MSEPQPICSPNAPIAEPDHVNLAPESHDSHVTDGGGGSGADTPSRGGVATGEGQPASLIPSATPQAEVSIPQCMSVNHAYHVCILYIIGQ